MKSILIVAVLITVATITHCTRVEKKEKFVIVVKGNDDNNSTMPEVQKANTTKLENISEDYKHDFKKLNKTSNETKKIFKFEAKDGRIYRKEKSVPEDVTQEPNYSNDNIVLSLPPPQEEPIVEKQPNNLYVYPSNPYMAYKLCPVPLVNYMPETAGQGNFQYVPQPYLYQAPTQTSYRVPKKLVVRYKPILEVVDETSANVESSPYDEVPPPSYGPMSGNGFMVVYPNGLAKMVEPITENYLPNEPADFTSDGAYYHDGVKEYELPANSAYQPTMSSQPDPHIYMYAPPYEPQENNQYNHVENNYAPTAYDEPVQSQYTGEYNHKYSGDSTGQGWQQNQLDEHYAPPTANANYEYNSNEVSDHQNLFASESRLPEAELKFTPSLDNTYGNANPAGYSVNSNNYYTNTQGNYEQQRYGGPVNNNYQYTNANGQNGGAAASQYDTSKANAQNEMYWHNLRTTAPTQQNQATETGNDEWENKKYKH